MSGGNAVLLVLEGQEVNEEAMRHAIELARRLECSLAAVVLPGGPTSGDGAGGPATLVDARRIAGEQGIELAATARYGDRASELLKHLAECGPVRALVWGGAPRDLTSRRFRGGQHWLGRIRSQLGCPIVTAARRTPRRP